MIHSELFGHLKGSFTGAIVDREGLFIAADGGILFMDEIGDLPIDQQGAFLRALDLGEVRPVGASRHHTVNVQVRVVAATNKQLDLEVKSGRFREDLYHRLIGLEISLPALRDRLEDIPALARHFSKGIATFSPKAIELMMQYKWPGNVRELKFKIEAAMLRAGRGVVLPEHFERIIKSVSIEGEPETDNQEFTGHNRSVDKLLCYHTLKVLANVSGNKTKAAEILGVCRKTIYNWLHRWRQIGLISDSSDCH